MFWWDNSSGGPARRGGAGHRRARAPPDEQRWHWRRHMGRAGDLHQRKPPCRGRRDHLPQGDARVPHGLRGWPPHGVRPPRRHVAPHGGAPQPQGLGRVPARRQQWPSLRRREALCLYDSSSWRVVASARLPDQWQHGQVRTSTGEFSFNTVDELYASGGSQSARPDVLLCRKFPDELDLICPGSLTVLHEISLRVVRAGYTKELLQTFTNAPCDVLDRFLSILQVGCSLETYEAVSYDNAEW